LNRNSKKEVINMRRIRLFAIAAAIFTYSSSRADFVTGTYTSLSTGATIDLTSNGTLDWAKFGTDNTDNTTTFYTATKIGNPVINPNLAPLGTATSGAVTLIQFGNGSNSSPTTTGNLNFKWSNGNFGMGYNASTNPTVDSVNSVITETILPAVNSYPLGLGAEFTATADAGTRTMDVYVQGFNSVMTITASLSGGKSTSVDVTPATLLSDNNYYAFGVYEISYSGAGETLTVSVQTSQNQPTNPAWLHAPQVAFPNAGIFAATVQETVSPAPEPASAILMGIGSLMGLNLIRRRRRCG
jgi:hypothetical protein